MKALIETFKDWPIILQGALGSAAFWIILTLFQKISKYLTEIFSQYSKRSRESWLVSRLYKFRAFQEIEYSESSFRVATLNFRSLRFLYKGLMWLCLGFILQTLSTVAGVIGFCGCLFYISRAYEVVSPYDAETQEDLRIAEKEVLTELREMGLSFPSETEKTTEIDKKED